MGSSRGNGCRQVQGFQDQEIFWKGGGRRSELLVFALTNKTLPHDMPIPPRPEAAFDRVHQSHPSVAALKRKFVLKKEYTLDVIRQHCLKSCRGSPIHFP
jgi:hypothetical protein